MATATGQMRLTNLSMWIRLARDDGYSVELRAYPHYSQIEVHGAGMERAIGLPAPLVVKVDDATGMSLLRAVIASNGSGLGVLADHAEDVLLDSLPHNARELVLGLLRGFSG